MKNPELITVIPQTSNDGFAVSYKRRSTSGADE
jgi:hypothetical protein